MLVSLVNNDLFILYSLRCIISKVKRVTYTKVAGIVLCNMNNSRYLKDYFSTIFGKPMVLFGVRRTILSLQAVSKLI